jgi:hypothetical protein
LHTPLTSTKSSLRTSATWRTPRYCIVFIYSWQCCMSIMTQLHVFDGMLAHTTHAHNTVSHPHYIYAGLLAHLQVEEHPLRRCVWPNPRVHTRIRTLPTN